jgi:hypothetical protein
LSAESTFETLYAALLRYRAEPSTLEMVSVPGGAVSPTPALKLYSLYDNSLRTKLPTSFTMELILLRDNGKSLSDLAYHFSLPLEEVEWFFMQNEQSTAVAWAGGLQMHTDQDNEDYSTVLSSVLLRWGTAKELQTSYVFWTYCLGYLLDEYVSADPVSEVAREFETKYDMDEAIDRWWDVQRILLDWENRRLGVEDDEYLD